VFTIGQKKTEEPTDLEKAITELIARMRDTDPIDEDYSKMTAHLKTLMEARALEAECKKDNRISADQLGAIVAHLIGIGMILGFEKSNVLTSKALGFVTRPRI
jgi:hypothetical protein